MRIRRRPQPQIPASPPDPAADVAAELPAGGGAVPAATAAVDDVALLLHRVGDPPTPPGGCNINPAPPASRGAPEAGDLPGRSSLRRPGPKIDSADDGGRTAAAQTLLLLQGEQYQEAVVDAHGSRRAWSLGTLHSTNRPGAEASRSKRRVTGAEESTNPEPPTTTTAHVFTTTTTTSNDDDDGGGGGGGGGQTQTGKRKRPTAGMEGSRCSRVNGRGWRCFRQTLVGYSLCEHHLGKGRLRSLSATTKRRKLPKQQPAPPISEDEEEELKLADSNARRRKARTVKARSISSLLVDQTVPIPLPPKLDDESPPATRLRLPALDPPALI